MVLSVSLKLSFILFRKYNVHRTENSLILCSAYLLFSLLEPYCFFFFFFCHWSLNYLMVTYRCLSTIYLVSFWSSLENNGKLYLDERKVAIPSGIGTSCTQGKIISYLVFSHIILLIGNIKLIQELVYEYLGTCIFLPLHSDSI